MPFRILPKQLASRSKILSNHFAALDSLCNEVETLSRHDKNGLDLVKWNTHTHSAAIGSFLDKWKHHCSTSVQ